MSNEEKYLLVEESIAPDIFKKVLEAKKYLATGKARNSSEAVRLARHLPQRFLQVQGPGDGI